MNFVWLLYEHLLPPQFWDQDALITDPLICWGMSCCFGNFVASCGEVLVTASAKIIVSFHEKLKNANLSRVNGCMDAFLIVKFIK